MAPIGSLLHVIPHLSFGGAALGVIELAWEFLRRGDYDVRLCVLGSREGQPLPQDLAHRTTFLGVPNPTASIAAFTSSVLRLRRVMKDHAIQIAHSHLLPADLVTAAAAACAPGTRHIAHIRDTRPWLMSRRPQDSIRRQLHRVAYSLADTRFVAVSSSSADYTCRAFKIEADRMTVVLNGVDLRRLDGPCASVASSDAFRIGCAGRLVAEKGLIHVIEAAALLVAAGHEVSVTIVGSGSSENALRRRTEELGLVSRVAFSGPLENMSAFYQALDVLVVPSLATEGLPRVALEAMAMGRPVIAATTAGAEDLIKPGLTGLLVPPSDPQAIANAIVFLKQDAELRGTVAANGRSLVRKNFTVQRVADEVERAYRRIHLPDSSQAASSERKAAPLQASSPGD